MQLDNGWIPINLLQPPTTGRYLTYSESSEFPVQVHKWVKDERGWEHEIIRAKSRNVAPRTWVTHWQPAPLPPTGAGPALASEAKP